MKRSTRLLPVLKIADLDVKKAARSVTFMKGRLIQEQEKLGQLAAYQKEYHENLIRDGRAGISPARIQMVSRFSGNLDQAMNQQRQQIKLVSLQLEEVRTHWRKCELRFRQLEKMLQRISMEEQAARQRQEQRNHDEYARRSAGRAGWDQAT